MARDGGFGRYGMSAPPEGYNPTPGAPRGFGPPGGMPPLGGPMTPGSGSDVDTTLPLVLSIVSTLLCCDPVLGVPAIVLAIQARNAANRGDIDLARKRARVAVILALVAIGAGFLLEVIEGVRSFATLTSTVH
jgi:Interferon-induced transmembrane protein